MPERDRVNEESLRIVEAVDADMIVERPRLLDGAIVGHGRAESPAAKEIDFDKMHLAAEHFSLLADVQVTAVRARRFVRDA